MVAFGIWVKPYFMPRNLIYCQGLALKYMPYRFQKIDLQSISIHGIDDDSRQEGVIWINFRIPREDYYKNVNKALYILLQETNSYLEQNRTNELGNKCIDLFIADGDQITGLRNYNDSDTTLYGGKWGYYGGYFMNWDDASAFHEVCGIDCYMVDITDTQNIDVNEWKNLKYLHVWTYNDQETKDEIKERLTMLFPDVDIIVG